MQRRGNDERGGWELNGEHIQRSRVRIDTRKWMLAEGMDACLAAAAAGLKDADYRELAFKCCARVMGADRVFPLQEETVLGRVQQLLGLSDADASRLLVLATR